MQKQIRLILTALFLGAFLFSACTGTPPQRDDSQDGPGVNSNEVVSDNSNDANVNDSNANLNDNGDDLSNANDNGNGNEAVDDNSNSNSNDNVNANSNDAPAGPEQEAFGVVEAITADSITIDGVTYNLADFTEFKGTIAVGDQVKIHVIVNADGTFTIREIEGATGAGIGNDNNNSNSNDDHSNVNSNDNGNDDDSNSNSNGDDHSDDNSNNDDHSGSNSNDD